MQLATDMLARDTIKARLNYVIDTGTPPVQYIDWPEMQHKAVPAQYRQHEVSIRNGRPLRDTFKLDTHGFMFVDQPTRVKNFTDSDERKRVYDAEVQELIKRCSGASSVVVFDHTIRTGDEATRTAEAARPPVKSVHNDYTENSAPRRLREIVGDGEADARLKRRYAIVQVWRPIRRKVVMDPLAICDARSIPPQGFILVQRRYPLVTDQSRLHGVRRILHLKQRTGELTVDGRGDVTQFHDPHPGPPRGGWRARERRLSGCRGPDPARRSNGASAR